MPSSTEPGNAARPPGSRRAQDLQLPERRPRRRWLRLLVLVVALVIAVLAYQVVRTALALRDAEDTARAVSDALGERDVDAAESRLDDLRSSAATARGHSDGVLWRAATLVPFVGDDLAAVRQVSAAIDEVARAAPAGVDLLARLTDGPGLRTGGGAVDLDLVRSLRPDATRLAAGAEAAADDLADVDPATLVGRLAPSVTSAVEQVDALRSASTGIVVATDVLPQVLGADGEQRYLLVVQNNAEIRATGGLPGSASVLTASDGTVDLGFQGKALDLDTGSGAVADFLPGEEDVFGPLLVSDFRDTNFTPDFPRAASLMSDFVDESPEAPVDGVVSVDPVLLAEVLRSTGPVTVAGRRLDADNAVRELLLEPYLRLPDPDRQDAFFRQAARAIFARVLSDQGDQVELLRTLGEGVSQRRLLFWSDDDAVQQRVAPTAIAGALPGDTGRPEVGLYLNDGTQAKMQYFLRSEASVVSEGCDVEGRQVVRARLTLTNDLDVPVDELTDYVTGNGSTTARGNSLVQLRMFAPAGGELLGLEVDGERADVGQGAVYGRQVTQLPVELAPGESTEVVAQFAGRVGETGDPRLQWTPGIRWEASEQVATARC